MTLCCSFFLLLSSYPHGGWPLIGLMVSCMAALSATMYGVASCRFLFVDFESDRGDFSEFYLDPTSDGEVVKYRAAAGLFQWLVPFEETDWSVGRCAGYTELQRENFDDIIFEVARIFGVLSVLIGIVMVLWTWFLSCLSLEKCQIWLMRRRYCKMMPLLLVLSLFLPKFACRNHMVHQSKQSEEKEGANYRHKILCYCLHRSG